MASHVPILKSRFVVVLFIFSCILFVGTGLWASASIFKPFVPQSQELKFHVTNKSKALRVNSIVQTETQFPQVEISLTNNSSKNITAYVLSIGDFSMTTDFAALGSSMAPGETKIEKILPGNFAARGTGELTLAAVFFDDQTGEGEPERIANIRDEHQGIKEQLSHILPALKNAANSSQSDSDATLEALSAQASQLNTEIDNVKLSHGYRSGLDYIRQSLNINLKSLKNKKKSVPGFSQKVELRRLVEFYEQVLAKL